MNNNSVNDGSDGSDGSDELEQRTILVGSSTSTDSRLAGQEAAAAALGTDPLKLLVVYASPSHDLQQLQAGIASVVTGVPLIGCTTAGEIARTGPTESSVVVLGLSGNGFSIRTAKAAIQGEELRAAGSEVARCVEEVDRKAHTVLFLLSDGLSGDQQEIVRGAYQQVGVAIPLVGGCAGDDGHMQVTHQFFGDEVLTGHVVAAAISSDGPIGIAVRHGWKPVGVPMFITESSGVVVRSLDERPALDVYLDRLDAPQDARSDSVAFSAFAATRPIGVSRRGKEEVRFVARADFEARSIHCFAEVPQGGEAWIMTGDADSILSATDAACESALSALGEQTPKGVLVFDCIARKGVLGNDGITDEINRIGSHCGTAPVAGFYSYGEIARTEGVTGFHNQTLVVLAFG
ncbi:MAG: FIST N-terminal domain-containing protein [Microthrixaceae bacterium]